MPGWRCGIDDCDRGFEDVESLIIHQTTEHEKHECQVCGTLIPDGYFAIRHVFDEHTRAEYVRAYDADSAAVRRREEIQADVESTADLNAVVDELDGTPRQVD
ncbi:C2H2-type zinc finger protein [Halohasta salina]|uniref:C2H2-type zinc finger protein n=1 Tax=Halohasta salina TaxID=2961621 RepID=UPI0020A2DE0F|nr:C2H2-type zinc finger protein [Halohasta salina]